MRTGSDIAVVGGGLVGSALAFGLATRGATVTLFDPDADDLHASVGNFGLVWVQSKGIGAPAYADLSRRSAAAWDAFAADIAERSGENPAYERCGGVKIALSETELAALDDTVRRLHNQGAGDVEVISREALVERVPSVGPEAVGGAWCPADGHADPLATHLALRAALLGTGRARVVRRRVDDVTPEGGGFVLTAQGERFAAGQVVLTAGLGTTALAAELGLDVPLKPQRGQILVTEKLPHFLDPACFIVRQTNQGSVLIGDSKEDVGYDRGTTTEVGGAIAARAVRMFPRLAGVRVVRQWGALRVMSPDGLPIYAQSEAHPGAMALSCHSGVTLAAAHAGEVAEAVLAETLAERYPAFSPRRFAEVPA
ncbi:FAD-binding oxidoreductase [Acuticoccus sp. I52.16.1]|uniref:NAD(P)/FAD-dependent oxidoreductase n=1 Tax=Acuticoccus sp. I52.16.1 TaxID=2928472 RepID=UPI001FD4BC6A|nr:FAD-binding oxidoreductase [Acuticoccus sp. I52.16.1]UOM34082.1 FAD-binding oxidoreductase [Acuticoccus sp. I52.16.1]